MQVSAGVCLCCQPAMSSPESKVCVHVCVLGRVCVCLDTCVCVCISPLTPTHLCIQSFAVVAFKTSRMLHAQSGCRSARCYTGSSSCTRLHVSKNISSRLVTHYYIFIFLRILGGWRVRGVKDSFSSEQPRPLIL